MNDSKLISFQLVIGKKPISPWLITIRDYGRWMMEYFDESICSVEIFKKESKDGEPLRVYHPGSRLGVFFDKNTFTKEYLRSWFFRSDSAVLTKLYKYKLAKPADLNFIQIDGVQEKLLRTYTPDQIELYIKTNLDEKFRISENILEPKQIKIGDRDMKGIIIPEIDKSKKSLF